MQQAAIDRVELIFALFDADGSGSLEPEDFDLMASRVVAVVPDSAEPARAAMPAAFRDYWTRPDKAGIAGDHLVATPG